MSWKLAELKWRQELGLYESRWERENGALPLERKHAIQVFERNRALSSDPQTSKLTECCPQSSPERHSTRLGYAVPPASSSITLSASRSSPALPASLDRNISLARPYHSSNIASDASAVRDDLLGQQYRQLAPRFRSCFVPDRQQSPFPSLSSRPFCISFVQAGDREGYSFLLPALADRTPQPATPREQLTRLLDRANSGASTSFLASEQRLQSLAETADLSCCHLPEVGNLPTLTSLPNQAVAFPANTVSLEGTSFEILGHNTTDALRDISTTVDTSDTVWPTTISRHNSTSSLLPKDTMSQGTTSQGANGDSGQNGNTQHSPESNDHGTPRLPVRRTTPIYPTFGQAHTSITGGMTSARFDSEPGTDSLNNVYARAMNDEAMGPSTSSATASETPDVQAIGGPIQTPDMPAIGAPVRFPFQRSTSPETNDHMNPQDAGDNPAGIRIQSSDVALQPILRRVPRSSITYSTNLPREPSSLAFEEADRRVRDRDSAVPLRSPTPYPARRSSSFDSFLDKYGDPDDSALEEQSSESGADAGDFRVHPRQRRNTTAIGAPPAWPLPAEPSTQQTESTAVLSSPQGMYDTTSNLIRLRESSHLEHLQGLSERDRARNSSIYSSEIDEIIARRANSRTPFNQIGDPGPAMASSPQSSSAQAGSHRVPVDVSNTGAHVVQPQGRDDIFEPSSSSGIGIALTSTNDPVVRYELPSNVEGLLGVGAHVDDDAAWETTQGSNTQRNSAIQEVGQAAFSSSESLARQATSTWDPLATNMRGLAEAEREFAELQAVRLGRGGLGGAQTEAPEDSMNIASWEEQVNAGPATSVASQTFTTTTTPRVQQNNYYQQSLPGTSLLTRTPRTNILQSDTIVNMSSETASENERATRLTQLQAEIDRYEPRPADEGPRRFFPEARLTTDRRILVAETDQAFVRRQRLLTRLVFAAACFFYPIGGFLMVNSLASNGAFARAAILWLSVLFGGEPVNNVHEVDMALAEWAETLALFGVGAVVVGCVAVLVAAACGALA